MSRARLRKTSLPQIDGLYFHIYNKTKHAEIQNSPIVKNHAHYTIADIA
jgi:hypothetical protein